MIFEICTDTVEGMLAAKKYGVQRIELCSGLSVGGLTPSVGLVQQCTMISAVEVHVMIRHKEGGFGYSKSDIEIMKTDIITAKKAGASGVVFGVLNEKNEISKLNEALVHTAKSMDLEVTFHRAFDFVPDPNKAIEQLIELDFNRLLTSGLQPTAEEGLALISDLQTSYGSSIQIMAGSGVTALNAVKIAASGVNNLHFTARKSLNKKTALSMGEQMFVDEEKIKNIVNQFQ